MVFSSRILIEYDLVFFFLLCYFFFRVEDIYELVYFVSIFVGKGRKEGGRVGRRKEDLFFIK